MYPEELFIASKHKDALGHMISTVLEAKVDRLQYQQRVMASLRFLNEYFLDDTTVDKKKRRGRLVT
jgi:hypothetical protein